MNQRGVAIARFTRYSQPAARRGGGFQRRPSRALLDQVPELRQQVVRDELAEVSRGLKLKGDGDQYSGGGMKEGDQRCFFFSRALRCVTDCPYTTHPASAVTAVGVATRTPAAPAAPAAAGHVEPAHHCASHPMDTAAEHPRHFNR